MRAQAPPAPSRAGGAARLTQSVLDQADRLLGVILLGNNLVNDVPATLVTSIAVYPFVHSEWVLAIAAGSLPFAIIMFAEIAA